MGKLCDEHGDTLTPDTVKDYDIYMGYEERCEHIRQTHIPWKDKLGKGQHRCFPNPWSIYSKQLYTGSQVSHIWCMTQWTVALRRKRMHCYIQQKMKKWEHISNIHSAI